jgi:hypothetical protein
MQDDRPHSQHREGSPEHGERALQELKERLAKAPPPTSLTAAVMQRQQREERRRKAAEVHGAHAAELPSAQEPDTAALQGVGTSDRRVGLAAGSSSTGDDFDPREREPWFQDLPKKERERLRAHWARERQRPDRHRTGRRQRLVRALVYGALVFFGLSILFAGFGILPQMVVAGALAALCAELCGGGRFVYSGLGAVAFLLTAGFSILGLVAAAFTMAAVGMDGEMRRSGGFRDA